MADFYDCYEYSESLSWKTVDEAISFYLQETGSEYWPSHISVYAWTRKEIESADIKRFGEVALELILQEFDDWYSASRDGAGEPNAAMKVAALEFAQKVASEYVVYDCDRSPSEDREMIRLYDWIKENEPGLLEEIEEEDVLRIQKEG